MNARQLIIRPVPQAVWYAYCACVLACVDLSAASRAPSRGEAALAVKPSNCTFATASSGAAL